MERARGRLDLAAVYPVTALFKIAAVVISRSAFAFSFRKAAVTPRVASLFLVTLFRELKALVDIDARRGSILRTCSTCNPGTKKYRSAGWLPLGRKASVTSVHTVVRTQTHKGYLQPIGGAARQVELQESCWRGTVRRR